ncbi:MAG: DASS family sodium-coupled anion symporter [Vicinamibacterales bacterium]
MPQPSADGSGTPRTRDSGAWGLAAALVIGGMVLAMPALPGLPAPAQRAGALFVTCLILWVTEAVPIAVTALLAVALQPVLGLAPAGAAFASFMSPVFFFVLVMFVIAHALTSSGLERRFAYWLLARAEGSTRRAVLLLMVGTAASSMVVSDVPCATVFMAVALGLFDKMGLVPGQSQFARGVMIGIPIASLIGGIGTPAGSSVNVLGLGLLEQLGGVRVPFVSWMAIGVPMVAMLAPLAAIVVLWCYPPEKERITGIDVDAERRALGPLSRRERVVMAIIAVMMALWIASSWVPQIDVVVVAVLGAVAMFLPGVRLLRSWKEVEAATSWSALLMIGSVTSLGAVSASSGLAKWLVGATLGGLGAFPPGLVVAAIGVFIVVIHLLVPINPAIVASMVPPIILLATSTGQHPALYALPVVFTASCAFLLPLDAIPLVTYGKGYYRMFDMLLPGAVVSVAWVIVLTGLLLLLGPMLGLR